MAIGEADVFKVVVLAARADAFLAGRSLVVIAPLEAEEDVLELVHPGIGEKQRRVVLRDERRAADDAVPPLLEEAEKHASDFVAAQVLHFPGIYYRRGRAAWRASSGEESIARGLRGLLDFAQCVRYALAPRGCHLHCIAGPATTESIRVKLRRNHDEEIYRDFSGPVFGVSVCGHCCRAGLAGNAAA